MAATWREDRPEAITAASHKAVRPSRSMVTIFSALSSSSEARMRLSRSLCGAAFLAAAGLPETAFLAAGLLTAFLTVLEDFVALLVVLAAGFLPAAFLVVLRVRAQYPFVSGG